MVKELNGRELAGFIKERQAAQVRSLRGQKVIPHLVIIRDSDNPVIVKYVTLKKNYGEDIGIVVDDVVVSSKEEAKQAVINANNDKSVHGMIVQLPLQCTEDVDEIVNLIAPEKDVDGLSQAVEKPVFYSATATAINWLLGGYNIDLNNKKIALVGRGRLVGTPLRKMWEASGFEVEVFHRGSDFDQLKNYDVIVTATGVPHLIKNEQIKPGAIIVDAGTASENGVLVGDVDDEIRAREDLAALTPKIGGVGPLTVSVLFDDVIIAASKTLNK